MQESLQNAQMFLLNTDRDTVLKENETSWANRGPWHRPGRLAADNGGEEKKKKEERRKHFPSLHNSCIKFISKYFLEFIQSLTKPWLRNQ